VFDIAGQRQTDCAAGDRRLAVSPPTAGALRSWCVGAGKIFVITRRPDREADRPAHAGVAGRSRRRDPYVLIALKQRVGRDLAAK
jgi:hypothetical protein